MTITKTHTFIVAAALAMALMCCTAYLFALSAQADTRSSSSRSDAAGRGATEDPAPEVPAPVVNVPSGNSGGTHTSASSNANSGGNMGGNVTTGDEHAEAYIVNTGPSGTTVTTTSGNGQQPAPEDTCDGRCDRSR